MSRAKEIGFSRKLAENSGQTTFFRSFFTFLIAIYGKEKTWSDPKLLQTARVA
jgi:hypothetical protein